ncbi:ABC transporter permease [[Eubacterium] cellulosolvens]
MSNKYVSNFWSSYKRSKMGMVGLAILILFIIMAVFAPILSPYHPIDDRFLAEGIALPAWYRIFPQYRGYPKTMSFHVAPVVNDENWNERLSGSFSIDDVDPMTLIFYSGNTAASSGIAELVHYFDYQYDSPLSFQIHTDFQFDEITNMKYRIELFILNPDHESFLIWNSETNTRAISPRELDLDSKGLSFDYKSKMGLEWYENVAERIFTKKGTYAIIIRIQAEKNEHASISSLKMSIGDLLFNIPGRLHGVLGTDHLGSDLFSQLLYGARISLLIGVSAALLAVSIGLFVGLLSGYQSGLTDEVSMRMVDVLLVLPGLPLLMILSGLFGRNIWNIVFLLGILSWPGFARVVRAQVLQLKTATFVEASRALGSSNLHIIFRHLLGNVLPLAFATIALYIPGAIITEAALSFLALGDPNTPSWGRMLYSANAFGAFQNLAWWWIIPPGIAITLISLSFVFIGTTLNEILNPKIQARR